MKYPAAPFIRPCLWLVVVSLGASLTAAAQAQTGSLAILGLSSKDGDDDAAAELTDVLRDQAAADSELALSDSTALLSQLVVLHDCEIADASCRDGIARQLEVDALIYGAIGRTERGHKVELHHYSRVDGSLRHASRDLTIEGAIDDELASDARGLLRELLGRSSAAEQPEPAPAVRPARVRRPAPLREPPSAAPQDEASSNDWLGYSLLGVAAVSAGLMVFSWNEIDEARNNPDFRAYREAVGRSGDGAIDDVCAEADAGESYGLGARVENVRDACSRGVTFEILQWVFIGSALASAGVGTYFLLDDDGEPDAARASLSPLLGKDEAGLTLRIKL
jgi:hypothetical protein